MESYEAVNPTGENEHFKEVIAKIYEGLKGKTFKIPNSRKMGELDAVTIPEGTRDPKADPGFLWIQEGGLAHKTIASEAAIFRSKEGRAVIEEVLGESSLSDADKEIVRRKFIPA